MYFKQLILRGFKSFASATTLNFESGITCIVDPNGSGKFNVMDALSWVMREQGAKSLRGGKMEDVIFAGTPKRAPLGRAEVQLTIGDSGGASPIEYSEVTITRTMFRSGGSEYAINGIPSRLLDVTELLSDSGTGQEMHVIVGQGQLDTILQAIPESRRGFIEEAAGALKHRKRKEKATRKLEDTRANPERLQDLIGELQRQLKPFGRQAEVARRAAVIQAEQRDAKARLLADDLHAVRETLATDPADRATAAEAKERAETEARATMTAEEAVEVELKEASRNFDRCREHWYALAVLKERVSSTTSVAAERMRHGDVQPAIDVSDRDPDSLEAEAREIRRREAEPADDIEQARPDLNDASGQRGEAETRHTEAEQAYAATLRAVADRREGLARLKGQVASVRSRLETGQGEEERLATRREEALTRVRKAADQYRQAENTLAGLGTDESSLDSAWETVNGAVAKHEIEVARIMTEETRLAREKAALTVRVEALRLATQQHDDSTDLLERPGVLGRLGDLVQAAPGQEQTVATGLGVTAKAVVTTRLDDAVSATAHLAEEGLGRAHVVASGAVAGGGTPLLELITAPRELKGALSRLLAGIVAVEGLPEARGVIRTDPSLTAVTRAGDRVSGWPVEGGSTTKPSLLALNADLTEIEEQLKRITVEVDRQRFALDAARSALQRAHDKEATALAALHESDAQFAAISNAPDAHRRAQAAATREAERLASAIETARQGRSGHKTWLAELEVRLATASGEEILEPDPTNRDELVVTARLARQTEMEARLLLQTVEEQARSLAGRADGLLRAATAERQSRAKARARAERFRREAAAGRTVHDAAQRLFGMADVIMGRAVASRDAAEARRRAVEAATVKARQASRAAGQRLEELTRGAHRDGLTRIERRMRIEQLEEKSLTELGLEGNRLAAEYGPDQPVPVITQPDGTALGPEGEAPEPVVYVRAGQEKRLRHVGRGLAALGRINPLVLEGFEALKTRHAFLAEQLADLKQTHAGLLALIDDVDRRVQEVFEAAYRDVERTFGEIFQRFFPGGEGKLLLTEPGNRLETGVDIETRPAGKEVKRLSLFSGGKRSLVAVILLVSLFIARPSPFYILDEVEATLDDANLGRLLGIYEELRQNSQLLVITRQERTMGIADNLYSVIIRDDGLSTVVSQRLQQP